MIDLGGMAEDNARHRGSSVMDLFKRRNLRVTILASAPWFQQDLGADGIGIFTPTVSAASVGHEAEHVRSFSEVIANDSVAAKGGAMVTAPLILGIASAVVLADRVGRIMLQIVRFRRLRARAAACPLFVEFTGAGPALVIFAGFVLFNFTAISGPPRRATCWPPRCSHAIRGQGAGLAAVSATTGAVLMAVLFRRCWRRSARGCYSRCSS